MLLSYSEFIPAIGGKGCKTWKMCPKLEQSVQKLEKCVQNLNLEEEDENKVEEVDDDEDNNEENDNNNDHNLFLRP